MAASRALAPRFLPSMVRLETLNKLLDGDDARFPWPRCGQPWRSAPGSWRCQRMIYPVEL